jgi:hypothetical protein
LGFDSAFLKEAIALNIVNMKALSDGVFAKIGLIKRRTMEKQEVDLRADINILGRSYLVDMHHLFKPGRTQSYNVIDSITQGVRKSKTGSKSATFTD